LLEEISVLKQRIKDLELSEIERRRAEEALRESEQKFKDLAEKSIAGIYLIQDGIFKYVNLKLAQILGYEIDQITDKIFVKDVVFPEDWSVVEENMRKRIEGELGSLHYEFRVVTKNKEVKNAEVYSSRTIYRGKPTIIGTYLDITERKQTEEALRESEARWQFALEGAGDGVWDWDAASNHVFFSARWKAMLGYADHEIGDTLDEWERRVYPDDKACVHADLERHFRHETAHYQSEHRVLCKDGSYKWILDRGKVIKWDQDGRPSRMIGTHTDITSRKRAEEEEKHSEKLSAALEMAGAICHELNQPLQVISGRIDLLSMESKDERAHKALEIISDQIRRIGTITKKLMGLRKYSNRAYAGTMKIANIDQTPEGSDQ